MLTAMARVNNARKQCMVLLVEDSAETYELYSEVLAKAGYAVVGADNGEQAYQLAVSLAPDLVIMDHELRGVDGCAATERLKQDPRTARIPIVMITGHVSRQDFERARTAGCDAFLAKPISYEQLLGEVKRHMHPAMGSGTVLLVEDDEDIRASVAEILRDEGFQVVGAADGDDALRYLRSAAEPPRLILLDLMMPVMDGWEVAGRMHDEERLSTIPVCVVTATPEWAPSDSACVLRKPIDVDALLAVVRENCSDPH